MGACTRVTVVGGAATSGRAGAAALREPAGRRGGAGAGTRATLLMMRSARRTTSATRPGRRASFVREFCVGERHTHTYTLHCWLVACAGGVVRESHS
jgi:hypothetical protein